MTAKRKGCAGPAAMPRLRYALALLGWVPVLAAGASPLARPAAALAATPALAARPAPAPKSTPERATVPAATPMAPTRGPTWAGAACSRLAYIQTVNAGKLGLRYDLRVSLPDGSQPVTVQWSFEPLMTPAWSPDGRFLTYTGFFNGRTAIVEQRLVNRSRRTLSIREGLNSAPAYSPDGRYLAYALSNGSAVNIFVEDLRTYKTRRLTDGRFVDTEPAWSPDGRTIAFTSDRAHGAHIYGVPAGGGKATMLSPAHVTAVHPVFTPDGRSLVFSMLAAKAYRICRLDLATRQVHLQTAGRSDQNPAVSPDGRYVVWVGGTMQQRTLHGMQLDHPGRLLWSGPSSVQEVAWSTCTFPR